ncbi:31486_t:CDS:2 [Gigaspora margarita]|uniref:31486_t:CDS:1 n=1 Tax=Gigaspora margarita TaxID=4874 RepID=A0ABN7V567_GIGMA|nr:31486_t:CDS:2 [Gigaspora margarita]
MPRYERNNLENVKNPDKVFTKGRPSKRRLISSVEKEQGNRGRSKNKRSYKCRICNTVGHNAAFNKKGNNDSTGSGGKGKGKSKA